MLLLSKILSLERESELTVIDNYYYMEQAVRVLQYNNKILFFFLTLS